MLKARGVLGVVVGGGEVIESAAVARAREATPSCEEGVWRMLERVGLRRPRRPFGANIMRCFRVTLPRWAGSSAVGSSVVGRANGPQNKEAWFGFG